MRRKIGLKALELGGNAVTGYRQCFDLEGETGIVVRGIGTAVSKHRNKQQNESTVVHLKGDSNPAARGAKSRTSSAIFLPSRKSREFGRKRVSSNIVSSSSLAWHV